MIYKYNNKELKKILLEFSHTTYGKIIFISCYIPFFISLINLLLAIFILFYTNESNIGLIIMIMAFISTLLFSIGSYAYYKEVRIYVKSK